MKSQASDDFWKLYAKLPDDVKRQAHKAFKQFQKDPFYPSLNFEEVDKQHHIWSARVSRQYRALGVRSGTKFVGSGLARIASTRSSSDIARIHCSS